MKKLLLIIIVLSLAPLVSACQADESVAATAPQPEVATPSAVEAETPNTRLVSAEGLIVPKEYARLAFEVGGQVEQAPVESGQTVEAGQLLIQLDDREQQLTVDRAEANLSSAKSELARLLTGSTLEEIAQAEAAVAKAEARLAQLLAGSTPEEVAEAAADVDLARTQLAEIEAGNRPESIEAAAAEMLYYKTDVLEAQANYDAVVFGEPTDAEEYAVALEQATLLYEQAKAQYEELVNGPTPEEVAVYEARVIKAQASLNRIQARSTRYEVLQVQADVAEAEARLAQLQTGPTAEEVALAENKVEMAQVDLDQARLELSKRQLTSPFAGVVVDLKAKPGEIIQPGSNAAIVADTSTWQVETTDLTETDIAQVRAGQTVQVFIDALPGQEFTGRVLDIAVISEAERAPDTNPGEVTYKAAIEITDGPIADLRWGMTAFEQIEVEQ